MKPNAKFSTTKPHKSLNIKWLSILIFGTVLCLLGCQPSNDTKTAPLDELIIALDWTPNTNHTGLYVALDKGYFAEQGFDVKIVQPSEDSTSTLVANNRAHLGVYFQPNMVKRLNKGEPITAIAAIVPHNNAGLLSLKSLGATTPALLHGKRYSTWEDPIDDKVVASLVGEPLNPIPGESTDATSALRMNQFDYILAYYSWDGIHAGLKGVETNFSYLKDANPVFDYYSPVLIANSDQLQKNPERYKKALNAISQGYMRVLTFSSSTHQRLTQNLPKPAKNTCQGNIWQKMAVGGGLIMTGGIDFLHGCMNKVLSKTPLHHTRA